MIRIVENEGEQGTRFDNAARSGKIVVESDLEGADAINELQSMDTTRTALAFAAGQLGKCGVTDSCHVYPVDADGEVMDMTKAAGQMPDRYRIEIPVQASMI